MRALFSYAVAAADDGDDDDDDDDDDSIMSLESNVTCSSVFNFLFF